MGNINKCSIDYCLMDYSPDKDTIREKYGDEAADNYVIWNFKERLGNDVDIISISVAFVVSWELQNVIPRKVMYMCTYCRNYEKD